ncbi:hypothetical protein BJX65DRAFT_288885 [Aspergillus insuetus]
MANSHWLRLWCFAPSLQGPSWATQFRKPLIASKSTRQNSRNREGFAVGLCETWRSKKSLSSLSQTSGYPPTCSFQGALESCPTLTLDGVESLRTGSCSKRQRSSDNPMRERLHRRLPNLSWIAVDPNHHLILGRELTTCQQVNGRSLMRDQSKDQD